MKPFRYGFDGLCLLAVGAYALNRWIFKSWLGGSFLRGHFNDFWLIPAALPWVLWLQRKLRLRTHDRMPTWREILGHVALWSVLFEVVGPRFIRVTGDAWDVVAYAAGALLAGSWWQRRVPSLPAPGI